MAFKFPKLCMEVNEACKILLVEVGEVIEQISDQDFCRPIPVLNGSTLGQHFRHTLEFFECLSSGSKSGIVSYDQRDHDSKIENDRDLALGVLNEAIVFMNNCQLEKNIKVAICYDLESDDDIIVDSNMAREIAYNIEHVIHHMALIKIGVQAICPYVVLPKGFGIAVSTLKYRNRQSIE